MSRTNEIKSIMRQLKENKKSDKVKYEAVNRAINEEDSTENDSSEEDLLIARLEDILSRFEKVIAVADGEAEEDKPEEPAEEEEESAEEDKPEEEPAEEEGEEPAEESYTRSLERRIADLERRYTESRRRNLVKSFRR